MNKLRLILSYVLIFSSFSMVAEKVNVEKAKVVAENFLFSKTQLRSSQDKELSLAYTAGNATLLRSTDVSDIAYYVFNVGENDGFILISGDDMVRPVLGYTSTGKYEQNNQPPAFTYWVESLQKEIEEVINGNVSPSAETLQLWEQYYTGNSLTVRSGVIVSPLISTKWSQGSPYNLKCPYNYVTGCVATAMAQIMKYYNYPTKGIGSTPSYHTKTEGIPVASVDFSQEPAYDWNNMTDEYNIYSSEVEKEAVAHLMYHCALSVETDFGLSASGALATSLPKALFTYFDYDLSIQTKQRIYYSDQEWEEMIRNELNNQRPVFYSGVDQNSLAHAFICDGYQEDDFFHFNWGWDGLYDGYFLTTALNPGTGGIGGGSGAYNYNQTLVVNIFPDQGNEENYEVKLRRGTDLTYRTPVSSVKIGEIFTVAAQFHNAGTTDFTGSLGVALVDESENIKEIIGMVTFADSSTAPGYLNVSLPGWSYYENSFNITCVISNAVSSGNYYIKAAIKPAGKEWITINAQNGYVSQLPIELLSESVISTADLYLYNSGNLEYHGGFSLDHLSQGKEATVFLSLINDGGTFIGDIDLGLYDFNNQLVQSVETMRIGLLQNDTASYYFYTPAVVVSPGEYKLILKAKAAAGESIVLPGKGCENEMIVTVGEPTSIRDIFSTSFSLYPNPATDQIFISNNEYSIHSVKISDLSGKTLKVIAGNKEKEIVVPVNDLNSGTYLVSVLRIHIPSQGKLLSNRLFAITEVG